MACCWFRSTAHDQSPVPPHNWVGEHQKQDKQFRKDKQAWQHQARDFSSLFSWDWCLLPYLASGNQIVATISKLWMMVVMMMMMIVMEVMTTTILNMTMVTRCTLGEWACTASCVTLGQTSGLCTDEGFLLHSLASMPQSPFLFPTRTIFQYIKDKGYKSLDWNTLKTHTNTRWMPVQRALDQPEQLASSASLSLPPWSLLLRRHLQLHWTEERHLRREGIKSVDL